MLNNTYIKAVDSIKDLGVIISSDLKFNHHISSIVARAHRVNNLIYKCFHCRDTDVLLKAHTTYVRPIVEYASVVWSPHNVELLTSVGHQLKVFNDTSQNVYQVVVSLVIVVG